MKNKKNLSLFDDVNVDADDLKGMVRNPDHHTSVNAAAVVAPKRSKLQQRVIDAFEERGRMSDETLENLGRFSEFRSSTVRKRRTELTQQKVIVCIGDELNSAGLKVKVWALAAERSRLAS